MEAVVSIVALLGAKALYLTYAWLGSAIVASYLSHRKGYGERSGLASGLLLNFVGVIVWLVMPPRENSLWRKAGPWGSEPHGPRDPRPESADTTERT